MTLYDKLQNTAIELITEFGQDVTILKKSATPTDATKPWRGLVAAGTSVNTKAVLLDYNEKDIDGDTVRRGDMKALLFPGQLDYRDFDQLTDAEGRKFAIVNVMLVSPGGTKVYYEMQLRK